MSNEFLGERRRGLEEAYFAKHNRELIARLRAESARRRDAAPSADANLPVPRAAVDRADTGTGRDIRASAPS